MRPIIGIFILLVCCLFIQKPHAEEKPSEINFSAELSSNPLTITAEKVIDPLTFLGNDNHIYRLAGLDVPGVTSFTESNIATQAKEWLEKAVAGQTLYIYQSRDLTARQNRMGHFPVHAVRKFDNTWLQGAMIEEGLARVLTSESMTEMAIPMLVAERKAREANKNLWADAQFKILSPEESLTVRNDIYIVEGTVKSAAINNNIVYLNFGDDWRKDFTIVVPAALRQKLSRANIDLLSFKDKKIRIRGFIESKNGPSITLTHFQQMELLEDSPH